HNLTSATDANGTTTFAYDAADRMTRVTYPGGRFLQFTYDAAGQRTQVADQSGFTVHYAYDLLGRLQRVTNTAGDLIASYSYDAVGRLARKDLGNGTFTTYAYDANSQLVSLVNYTAAQAVLSRFDYTYDDLGRPIRVTTLDGTTLLGYDAD